MFCAIFIPLYMVFHSATEALVLIFPTLYAMTGGLLLQWILGYNFSVAVWAGYIALFGIVGGMITSTIHVLILVPVFFVVLKERALKRNRPARQEEPAHV